MIWRLCDLLASVFARLSPRFLAAMASFFAFLVFSVLRIRRRVVLQNLSIAFSGQLSPREMAHLGFVSLKSFILTLLEFLAADRLFARTRVDITNAEVMKRAMENRKGVYFMCIHMGNWEIMANTSSREYGRPVHIVTKLIGGPRIAPWVTARRKRLGILEISRHTPRTLWSTVKAAFERGEAIGFIVDQRRGRGPVVPLFGQRAQTNASLFRLWRSLPAPIIPCVIHREDPLRHTIHVFDEFSVDNDASWSDEEFCERNAIRMNQVVESMILSRPDQYFWLHDRWKM